MRPLLAIVVLLFSAFMLAVFLPTLALLSNGVTAAEWPMRISARTVVASDTAAIRPGDLIDVAALTPDAAALLRSGAMRNAFVAPGSSLTVPIIHEGKRRNVVVHAVSLKPVDTPVSAAFFLLRTLSYIVFVFVGTALVLLRPSLLTAVFYVFCLATVSTQQMEVLYTFLPPRVYWFADIAFDTVFSVVFGYLAFVMFCALFPTGRMSRGRWLFLAAIAPVLFVAGLWIGVGPNDPFFAVPTEPVLYLAFTGVCLLLGTAFLLRTYGDASIVDKHRLKWVVAAIVVGLLFAYVADGFGALSAPLGTGFFVVSKLLKLLEVIIPIAVAYAVLRHRIIDVNFVISKAVVYTVLSAIVVGLFALVDLFFSEALAERRAGLVADVALALVLGFFFNSMHNRVDKLVDGLLFRNRYRAEKHMELIIDAVPYADNERDLADMLVAEPVRTFGLTSGVLKRNENGRLPGIPESGKLIAYLRGCREPLRMEQGDAAIAVPVFSHGDLAAVAFYGLHANGSDLDAEEVRFLNRLAAAAGAAFDRLEAAALRAENQALRVALQGVPIA